MNMPIPEGIELEGSYVLAISILPYEVHMKMDFLLNQESSLYVPPISTERGCYRRGEISIRKFSSLHWDATGTPPAFDALGESDYGCLDSLIKTEEGFELYGDWGAIRVNDGEFSIKFDDERGIKSRLWTTNFR